MIRVPQRLAKAVLEFPFAKEFVSSLVVEFQKVRPQRHGIHPAPAANTSIAFKDPIAQIAGIGAQFPLMNARLGAEGSAPRWHFGSTTPAKRPAGRSFGQFAEVRPASRLGALA